jgi:VCBS repeat-containing protein
VSDDVPLVTVDGPTTVVEGQSANGTWSQTIGADQPGNTTKVFVTGDATAYAVGAPITVGTLGTLTVNANNTWVFTANNNINGNPSVTFTIKVTDADGDYAEDPQTITIGDGAGPIGGDTVTLTLDDSNLADGRTAAEHGG